MIENSNIPIYFHPFFSKKYKRFERGAYYCFGQKVSFSGLYTWLRNIPPTGPDTHKIIQSL